MNVKNDERITLIENKEKKNQKSKLFNHIIGFIGFVMLTTLVLIQNPFMINIFNGNNVITQNYKAIGPPLKTKWSDEVIENPNKVWKSHPRPQLYRSEWKSLNGIWEYSKATGLKELLNPPFGKNLTNQVLIPSCIESGLSGISETSEYNWFKTSFEIDENFKNDKILINFGAVDYEASVYVNGIGVGTHRGGYSRFSFDISKYVKYDNLNELLVFVRDPTDSIKDNIPLGKQRNFESHMFFTPCSGIWQSVFIESVPNDYITDIDINADKNGNVNGVIHTINESSNGEFKFILKSRIQNKVIGSFTSKVNQNFSFTFKDMKLWSINEPNLYDVEIHYENDKIESYIGFRTVSIGLIEGIPRPLVNDEWVFQLATLDEGYWPDSLYVPPTKEAMEFDIKFLKSLGFTTIRKHIKVENDEYYAFCDKIGMLVWQDMPSLMHDRYPTDDQVLEFERQAVEIVKTHKHFPSIVTWVLYNEGWGQQDWEVEGRLIDKVKQVDDSRLINAASGWKDHGLGDFHDNHHYSDAMCGMNTYSRPGTPYRPGDKRIAIQGEFSGIGHHPSIEHLWPGDLTIPETYEVTLDLKTWNFRVLSKVEELIKQTAEFSCSGAVITQTTDIEGEVNGLLTYDRKLSRIDYELWNRVISNLHQVSKNKGGIKPKII